MRLGIMCSGNGTNFENIVRTCSKDEVVIMVHNKKDCGALKRAAKFGIPHCYVNEELDGGEVIMQSEVPILPEDTIKSLTKAIQRKEYAILPAAIEHVKQQLLQQAS